MDLEDSVVVILLLVILAILNVVLALLGVLGPYGIFTRIWDDFATFVFEAIGSKHELVAIRTFTLIALLLATVVVVLALSKNYICGAVTNIFVSISALVVFVIFLNKRNEFTVNTPVSINLGWGLATEIALFCTSLVSLPLFYFAHKTVRPTTRPPANPTANEQIKTDKYEEREAHQEVEMTYA
mmetsp:Transcript_9919/g.12366  ORF Transcript_9919/g.12366 Transcript_9919/m.12366 type:complete len:184 (+) Transcript_9919:172-723(+)|eukprot:CAMPEP_0204825870 /NCGR_PEP_ID=MMETSP1346-20131115/3669_1 /ASSEMBLY_ACC=CAM_ASM_000771 /TAXON_ID=215587 /ORGANISM="Aplanochytrium stocchinoi, Strain GSBS06" /LENGTH=183 /DNA_ID=CAMNT_0051953647 /DNA_START=582 /DNA_END=1133 /DNA_ORIENTATION=-